MTLTYISANNIQGLSSDTKPNKIPKYSTFYETDSMKSYIFDVGEWIEQHKRPAHSNFYQMGSPLSTVQGQHFVHHFSGSSLDTNIWTFKIPTGTSGVVVSEGMQDVVDGGYKLIMTNGHFGTYDFNNRRQYDPTGSIIVGVCKLNNGNGIFGIGFRGDNTVAENRSMTRLLLKGNNGYQNIIGTTADGSGTIDHDTGVTSDGSWHTLKIEMTSTVTNFYVDGVLEDSSNGSENELDEKCQPMIFASASGSGSGGFIRYMECYNT